jgi:predicted  nucleic acid-binding Zn-ribbon protein
MEQRKLRFQHEVQQFEQARAAAQHRVSDFHRRNSEARRNADSLNRLIRDLDYEISRLKEAMQDEELPDISILITAKEQADNQYEMIKIQLEPIESKKEEIRTLMEQFKECQAGIERSIQLIREKEAQLRVSS